MRVLVVGAGIAGLSATISLAERGHEVTTIDKGAGAVGASIIVGHGAVHALQELGVLDDVLRVARRIEADEPSWWTHVYNARGERMPIPAPVLPTEGLPSMVFLYRPLLSDILLARARELRADVRFETPWDGTVDGHDLVIGADGLHSSVRHSVFPEAGEPVYTGAMSFRTMIEGAPDHWLSGLHFAQGGMGSVTTLLPNGLFYLAVGHGMERRRVEPDEARAVVREVLQRYVDQGSTMFAEVAERIDDEAEPIVAPYEWIWVDQPWHRGKVVLVGDAIHATTPNIGAAGGMAIEDGVVLGQELERSGEDLEAGLQAYEARRYERAKLVVDASVEVMLRQQRVPREPDAEARIRANAIEKLAEAY